MHIALISSLLANFSRAKGKLKWHWQIWFPFAKYYYLLRMLIQSLASFHTYKFIKLDPLQNPQLNGTVKTSLKEVHPSIKGFNSHTSYKNCTYMFFNLCGLYTTHFTLSVTLKKILGLLHYFVTHFTSSDWYAARLEEKYSYVYG